MSNVEQIQKLELNLTQAKNTLESLRVQYHDQEAVVRRLTLQLSGLKRLNVRNRYRESSELKSRG
jgi:sensor histidine kinase regulating citrate/malate metabolism